LRGLALNFASTHQAENQQGFSEVGENKQLLIAIVGSCLYSFSTFSGVITSLFFSLKNSDSFLKVLYSSVSLNSLNIGNSSNLSIFV